MAKRTIPSSPNDPIGDRATGAKKPRAPRAAKQATQATPAATASDETSAAVLASNETSSNGASAQHPAMEEPNAAAPVSPDIASNGEPTEEEIRHHAYLRFLERGGGHGYHLDDWVHAERELRGKR